MLVRTKRVQNEEIPNDLGPPWPRTCAIIRYRGKCLSTLRKILCGLGMRFNPSSFHMLLYLLWYRKVGGRDITESIPF